MIIGITVKGKATPITGLYGAEDSGRLRLQITIHSAHEGGKVVTLTHRPPLPPQIPWYSFLEAEHTEMSAATEQIPSVTAWNRYESLYIVFYCLISSAECWYGIADCVCSTYVVGSKGFRSDIQKPRQMENAVRDI